MRFAYIQPSITKVQALRAIMGPRKDVLVTALVVRESMVDRDSRENRLNGDIG